MHDKAKIVPFGEEHIPQFLSLAQAEGWICDPWEFRFLAAHFPQGCFCAEVEGEPAGFITSISYGTSGWIGNLIVHPEARGKGIGTLLMAQSIAVLESVATENIWLTASETGRPIYEKLGFTEMDTILRWRGKVSRRMKGHAYFLDKMLSFDASVWGEPRSALVAAAARRSMVTVMDEGFLVVQPCEGQCQIGPWAASSVKSAFALLERVISDCSDGVEAFLDAPQRNMATEYLLSKAGFRNTAQTSLMCRGRVPAYKYANLYALASMGSIG